MQVDLDMKMPVVKLRLSRDQVSVIFKSIQKNAEPKTKKDKCLRSAVFIQNAA